MLILIAIWIVSIIAAVAIAAPRREAACGFLMAVTLGPIGAIMAALLIPRR